MGQPALAVLGSRTRPGARSRRDIHLLPMTGQSCTPIPTSAMLWGECISSAAASVTTGGTWPLLDLKVRFGTCRFVTAFDESGVNLSGFLWEVPGKHRKCIPSCIFQHSLRATISWVFFPSGYPYQQFGFRHLASPLTHSYSPCTDCIKQWAFALHHYSGSWLPAECCLDFLWHKGTRTPSESKMQISGSYSVLRTADFVSQQWVISPLSDNSKCFCWKLCIKRLSKLKISSDFLFFNNKSNQHFQKYSSNVCINRKAETALELSLLVGNRLNFTDTRTKCLFFVIMKEKTHTSFSLPIFQSLLEAEQHVQQFLPVSWKYRWWIAYMPPDLCPSSRSQSLGLGWMQTGLHRTTCSPLCYVICSPSPEAAGNLVNPSSEEATKDSGV